MIDLRAMHTAAEEYVSERHWPIIVIQPIDGRPAKKPTTDEWQKKLLEPGCATDVLQQAHNIGLLLRDLVDIDLDCREAREAAAQFLPDTGLIYGHLSSPASHRLYRVSTPLSYKKFKLPDDDRGALLELRAMPANGNGREPTAFQSVLPPSIHPDTGEQYEWQKYEEAALIDGKTLSRTVHVVAITAALAKLHPAMDDAHKAARDEYRLAISGVLARRLPEHDALNVFTTALRIAGDRKDRQSIFQITLGKLRGNGKVKGVPALAAVVGQKAANAVMGWIDAIAETARPYVAEVREPGDESETERPPEASADSLEEKLIVESFAGVQEKPIEWLWQYRIPKHKLTIFSGNPDVGKTTVSIDVTARYTTGTDYADGAKNTNPAGEVLMLIAEDDAADTVKPRLIAAGAEVSKVHRVRGVEIRKGAKKYERMLALDTDIDLLEKSLKENPAIGLVVFDPITGYLGKAELNKEQELRRVLVPIRELAERASVTIVGLGHFNKRSDVTALHRVGGAVAMSGVPRAVWLFVKDPDEAGLYKMLLGKGNLTKKRTGLKYRFAEKILPTGGVPVIAWEGETADDAEDAVAVHDPKSRQLNKAKKFLNDHFKANPTAQPSQPLIEAAAEQKISEPTLFRARKVLQIDAYRQAGVWIWEPKDHEK